jgi:hypothetical protein
MQARGVAANAARRVRFDETQKRVSAMMSEALLFVL